MKNKIWRITIDTNPEDCNLKCIMCEEHSELSNFKEQLFAKTGVSRRVMPKEWISKIIDEAASLGISEIIPTTMGDPLVSKNFEYMAELVANKKLKMNITHNGTFPRKSIKEWADMIIPITSDIKISWNGGRAETAELIMKGLHFKKAIENIKEFATYRNEWYQSNGNYCSISLQLTFMQNNMHEIEEIIQLASQMGVDRIMGHHLWVHHPSMSKLSYRNDPESINQWNKVVLIAKNAAQNNKLPTGKVIKLENFNPIRNGNKNIIPEHFECPFLGKELWVSATGKISPCCAPDEQRNSLGDFGNIANDSLEEVISSHTYQDLVLNYKNKELCKNCNMRKPKVN